MDIMDFFIASFGCLLLYIHPVQWELSANSCFMKNQYMVVIRLASG